MLDINLDKPICFIDIETTGLDFKIDEIIQLKIKRINPNQTNDLYEQRFNPTVEIQAESFESHGITKEELEDESLFKDCVSEIIDFISDFHIAGFNISHFDLPFLIQKLYDNGITFNYKKNGRRIIDVKNLYQKLYNPNSIEFAHKYLIPSGYIDKKDDNDLSQEILEEALYQYKELENEDKRNINDVQKISSLNDNFDLSGKIILKENDVYFNFGKYKDKKVSYVMGIDSGYLDWVMKSDIPIDTKLVLKGLLIYFKNKK